MGDARKDQKMRFGPRWCWMGDLEVRADIRFWRRGWVLEKRDSSRNLAGATKNRHLDPRGGAG